jgi:hypothetical protein
MMTHQMRRSALSDHTPLKLASHCHTESPAQLDLEPCAILELLHLLTTPNGQRSQHQVVAVSDPSLLACVQHLWDSFLMFHFGLPMQSTDEVMRPVEQLCET